MDWARQRKKKKSWTDCDAICQESREGARDAGGAEEEGLSELGAVAWVPEGDVVGDAGVETGLCCRLVFDLGSTWKDKRRGLYRQRLA